MSIKTPSIRAYVTSTCSSVATDARKVSLLHHWTSAECSHKVVLQCQGRDMQHYMLKHRVPHVAASTAATKSLMHLRSGRVPRRRFGMQLPVLLHVRSRSTACCQLVMCTCTREQMVSQRPTSAQYCKVLQHKLVKRAPWQCIKLLQISADSVRQGAIGGEIKEGGAYPGCRCSSQA